MLLRDATEGAEIDRVLLVREVDRRARRDGGEFLRVTLGDRSGQVIAMVWEDVTAVSALVTAGEPVHAVGRYVVHPRFGPQLNLQALRPAEPGTYELDELVDGPPRAVAQMEADLRELIG